MLKRPLVFDNCLSSPPSLFLCSYICFHFSQSVWQTEKKFQAVVILSQSPLLLLSLGRMARVSHLIMNASPGSWAWGRFRGGTVETWSGKAGSVQWNLFIKTWDSSPNTRIIGVSSGKMSLSNMFPVCWLEMANKKKKASMFKQSSRTTLKGKLMEQMEKLNLSLLACICPFFTFFFLHQECDCFLPNENKNTAKTYGIYLAFKIESATSGQPHITVSNILILIHFCIISSSKREL